MSVVTVGEVVLCLSVCANSGRSGFVSVLAVGEVVLCLW